MSQVTILVAEDEPNIAESLEFILQRAGFAVELALDGAEALDLLRRSAFAAVLLDIMLPGMNGFDVLKAIRADSNTADVPVVVLTAKGQANDRKTALAIGASAFITKPFSNAEVIDCVNKLTARQDADRGR